MNDHLRELHVCTWTYGKIFGGIPNYYYVFFFLHIKKKILIISHKTIHKALRIKKKGPPGSASEEGARQSKKVRTIPRLAYGNRPPRQLKSLVVEHHDVGATQTKAPPGSGPGPASQSPAPAAAWGSCRRSSGSWFRPQRARSAPSWPTWRCCAQRNPE